MAIWGIGVMVGPILDPTLGGYLTEFYNWRWVFYVNLPFGILAISGLMAFLPKEASDAKLRFDWIGFAVLALAIGAFQLMLDRGEDQDWFTSREIIVEAVLAGLGLYLFVVHMLTAEKPFLPPAIFRDRNFAAGMVMMFLICMVLLASSALLAPYLQNLANYPVESAGLAMAPRGIGTMAAMMFAGRYSTRIDPRLLMGVGIVMLCWSMWVMTGWTPDVREREVALVIVMQGAGLGLVFVPLQVVAFATLPGPLRTDGASLFSLFRNIGAAIGVSVTSGLLAHNAQVLHAEIGAYANPFNRALQHGAAQHLLDPAHAHGAAVLDQLVNQQAQIIAYMDDYRLMIFTTAPALLLLLLMRRPRVAARPSPETHVAMD
jgi:DHA2 family multidrug resistance protein